MNWYEIIGIVLILLLGATVHYFKTYTNISTKVVGLIAEAEELYKEVAKSGASKKEWCIKQLNKIIPPTLKVIFTDEILDIIIQNVFNQIKSYIEVKKIETSKVIENQACEVIDKVEESLNAIKKVELN